jgi:phycocyanobilin lyase beta subunit
MDVSDRTLQLIQAVETADSADALLEAVKALAAAQTEAAIAPLVEVLNFNNPGAAVAAVEGLIQLGTPAVEPLLAQIQGQNYGARAWAIRGLAGIGDPRALPTLLAAACQDFSLSVRRAAARGLGSIRWDQVPIEARSAQQQQVLSALLSLTADPEWVVRYAAIVSLSGLAQAVQTDAVVLAKIQSSLEQWAIADSELVVRTRALLALETLIPPEAVCVP